MTVFAHYAELAPKLTKPQVITIGNFDGVHLGHLHLLATAKALAIDNGAEVLAFTFFPHPAELFAPNKPVWRLVPPSRKTSLLLQAGADRVLTQKFDQPFAALSAQQFAGEILCSLKAHTVVVGKNFHFGKGRQGDLAVLQKKGGQLGYRVVGADLTTKDGAPISSSRIRLLIKNGNVKDATALLGRPHTLEGTVIHGKATGAGLGFPTINLASTEQLLPAPGIYAARCILADGSIHPAAAYVGNRPTLGHGATVEAHLIGFSGDLYGQTVALQFVSWLRDDIQFDSPEALSTQINIDIRQIGKQLEDHP